MAKGKELTFTLHIGDKQVDSLPGELLDKISERLSRNMSAYYSARPDEYIEYCRKEDERLAAEA